MNKKIIAIIFSIVALVAVVVVGVVLYVNSNSPSRQLQHQLDLGYKYLEELKYEQAIAAFEAAIEIDPKNVDSYYGLVDVYVGTGDADGMLDTYELAVANLDEDDLEEVVDSISDGLVDLIESAISDNDYTQAYSYLSVLFVVDSKVADKWFSRLNESVGNSSSNRESDDNPFADLPDQSESSYSDYMSVNEELPCDMTLFDYSIFGVDWKGATIDSLLGSVISSFNPEAVDFDDGNTQYVLGSQTVASFFEDSVGKTVFFYDSNYDVYLSDSYGDYLLITDASLAYPQDNPYARLLKCDKEYLNGHSLLGMNIYEVLGLIYPDSSDIVMNNSTYEMKYIYFSSDAFIQYEYGTYSPGLYSEEKEIIYCNIRFSNGYQLYLFAFSDTGIIYQIGLLLPN